MRAGLSSYAPSIRRRRASDAANVCSFEQRLPKLTCTWLSAQWLWDGKREWQVRSLSVSQFREYPPLGIVNDSVEPRLVRLDAKRRSAEKTRIYDADGRAAGRNIVNTSDVHFRVA